VVWWGAQVCGSAGSLARLAVYLYALAIPPLHQLIVASFLLETLTLIMALTLFQPDMMFDSDVPASLPTTPTVTQAQEPLWAFRQPFNPKSWSSGATSVIFLFCPYANRGQSTDSS
jgi:hypothetical protein